MLQMQFINATHQSQIRAKSAWPNRQRVIRGFGRFNSFALSNPALVSALFKKNQFQFQCLLADLGV